MYEDTPHVSDDGLRKRGKERTGHSFEDFWLGSHVFKRLRSHCQRRDARVGFSRNNGDRVSNNRAAVHRSQDSEEPLPVVNRRRGDYRRCRK